MHKLNKLAILIPLLFGFNVAEAGYQFRLYTPGMAVPACSDPWGGSLNIGQSVTAYSVGAVNYGQSCQSESRSCQNGVLTGSYTFQSCAVQTAQDCNLQGYVVTHNQDVFAYSAPTVAYNSSCDLVKETRTCTNGNLSGSFTNTSCSVTPELSCTFNGNTVTSAAPVDAYSTSTVPAGSTCASVRESRSCTNGVLSGSYANATCSVDSQHPTSCLALKTAIPSSASGTYTIDPDGSAGPTPAFSAYCDMTTEGGGWTMVVRQTDANPVVWTGATNGTSFSLSAAQLPPHTQTGFGKDNDPTFINYANFQYTTGNIPKTLLAGLKPGALSYHVHRNTANFYGSHNPENTLGGAAEWLNTLTFDVVGSNGFNWAFAPNASPGQRGYSMNGVVFPAGSWTVWVR